MNSECSEEIAKTTAQELDQNKVTEAGQALFDCIVSSDIAANKMNFLAQVKQNEKRDIGADLVIRFDDASGVRHEDSLSPNINARVGFEIK